MTTSYIQVSSKLTPQEWHATNYAHYFNSKKEVDQGLLLRNATLDLMNKASSRARKNQLDVTHKLAGRLQDVTNLKSEVDKEHSSVCTEMNALKYHIGLLRNALESTEGPMENPKKAISMRRKRTGNDLVRDQVEIQLHKEVQLIESVQAALRRMLDQSMDQYRCLESCKKRLYKDHTDKGSAERTDNRAYTLNNQSFGLGYHIHAVEYDPNAVSPPEWEAHSNNNISRAKSSRAQSEALRKQIQAVLAKCFQDINAQNASVQLAFGKRVNEMTKAKRTLEAQLRKINGEIQSMQDNVNMLEQNLRDLQAHLKVNNTRLEHRSYRPNMELCRDTPKHGLVFEYHDLSGDISAMKRRLHEARNALERLNTQKWELEQEIDIKNFSLYIDQDQCGKLRKQLDWRPFLNRSGSWAMEVSCRPSSRDIHSSGKISVNDLPRLSPRGVTPMLNF